MSGETNGVDNYNRAIEFNNPIYLPCSLKVDLNWLNEKNEGKTGALPQKLDIGVLWIWTSSYGRL